MMTSRYRSRTARLTVSLVVTIGSIWPATAQTPRVTKTPAAKSAPANERSVCLDGNSAPDAAIAACSRLIAADKAAGADLGTFYNQRAVAWLRKSQFDRALEDLNMAIKLDPKSATAFANRGYAFDGMDDVDHAIADFDEAIRLGDSEPHVFDQRGALWFGKEDYDGAIADFNEAIRRQPGWARAYEHRARAFDAKGDFNRAMADYDQAIKLDARNAGMRHFICIAARHGQPRISTAA
jgi:tetratricopeptide (TPR) repeat protein